MNRRRLTIAGMWVAAFAAMGGIYAFLEPADDPRRVDTDAAPIFHAGRDLAPREAPVELAVGPDEGSTALYRGGRRHTGRSPYHGPVRPALRFRYRARGRVTGQAVIGPDGSVYVGDHGRYVHAISPTGEPRWTAHAFGPIWSAPAIADGVVFVGSDADAFFAFDSADGSVRWRLRADGDADGSVAFAPDGTLRFTGGRDLYSVTPSGEVRWRFRARRPFLISTPAIDEDGTAYVGAIDHFMYAVAADGRMRWEYRTQGEISSSPVIGDDATIYFGSDDEHVYALTRDGALRWRTHVDGYVRAPVALGRDGSVIAAVYGPATRLVALDAATGEPRWDFPVGGPRSAEAGIASGPLVDAGGYIYFGAQDDFLYSITPRGTLRWVFRLGGDIDAAPILTPEGVLLVGCDDGYLYAVGDAPAQAGADAGRHDRDAGPNAGSQAVP